MLETLKVILNGIFKDEKIHKINIYAPENINFEPLLNLGFILEGIISDGIIVQGEYCSEILMGISRENYIKGKRVQLLEIKTKRLVLRILTNEDAQQVLEYYIRNKGHLEMYEPLRNEKFYTLKMQRNIIREGYRQFLKGTAMEFGVFKDKKLIGILKVSNIVYGIFKNGIIGYSIDKEEQGKGYMTESVDALIKYLFKEMQIHRVEASALVTNEASKAVLKKCGFKELGINEKYLFINEIGRASCRERV